MIAHDTKGCHLASISGQRISQISASSDVRATVDRLIRESAILVQNGADAIEAIGGIDPRMVRQGSLDFSGEPVSSDVANSDRATVMGLLGPAPAPVDEVIRLSGLSPAIVQTVLLELELAARLERHAGGRVSLS